jgi:NADPH-dependent ferric siderophore reductase
MSSLRRFPLRTGIATLVRRRKLTPRMIRVTLACDGFGADWPIQQPGEVITLLFPEAGEEVVLPLQGWRFPDGAPEQEWRNYTARAHAAAAGEIDVDVVLHEPNGPACRGAAEAPLGSPVGYAGPRVDYAAHEEAEWLLLCGDETALPAIAAILESAPSVARTMAVVEVSDAAEEQEIELPHGAQVRWVHRNGHPPATSSHLADALRAIELPGGRGQVWGAAESRIARDLRDVLRGERGMPRKHVKATGYWLRAGDWILEE